MATVLYNCPKCKVGKRVEYPLGDAKNGFYRTDELGNGHIPAAIWIQSRIYGKVTYGGDTENGLCPCCGKMMKFGKLVARLSDHKCSSKCTGSRGFICDCSCGGKNHGISNG